MNLTKRGHYIPECYSKNFCNQSTGYLYQKSKAHEAPIPVGPKQWGNKRYYYAYDKKDGTRDTQTLEQMFSQVEEGWPQLIKTFESFSEPYPEEISNLCTFIATMRIRVPNLRLQLEDLRAEMERTKGMVMSQTHPVLNRDIQNQIDAAIQTGDEKKLASIIKTKNEFDNGLFDVAVDPQTSLRGIKNIEFWHKELMQLNWLVLRTEFDQDFITTDNPVVWYDASLPDFIPYLGGLQLPSTEVIFPLTKKLVLIGNRKLSKKFTYATLKKNFKSKVKRLNRLFVIAAEEYVYSSQDSFRNLVIAYRDVAPRLEFLRLPNGRKGYTLFYKAALGKPHELPKWKSN